MSVCTTRPARLTRHSILIHYLSLATRMWVWPTSRVCVVLAAFENSSMMLKQVGEAFTRLLL